MFRSLDHHTRETEGVTRSRRDISPGILPGFQIAVAHLFLEPGPVGICMLRGALSLCMVVWCMLHPDHHACNTMCSRAVVPRPGTILARSRC